jgi:probable rRNA maturation factor
MKTDLAVIVNAGDHADVPVDKIRDAVCRSVVACGRHTGEFSVTFLGDAEIRAMNAEYLDRDWATDVISFSLGEPAGPLGDVYVGYDRAVAQAGEAGVSVAEEVTRLAIHGVLHVLGYDHPDGPERVDSPMFELQERLVREVFRD